VILIRRKKKKVISLLYNHNNEIKLINWDQSLE
jgi:hypothetical protein